MSESKDGMFTVSTGTITLVFVILKLTNVIHWSWWWVLSPLWISLAIALIVLVIVVTALLAGKKDE